MKKIIPTPSAPAAVGPYNHAVEAGGFLFFSGQIGLNPETGELVGATVETQVAQVLTNVAGLLHDAGLSLRDVVKSTIFMTDLQHFDTVNAVYAQRFDEPFPARSTVGVSALPKGALVEIEIIARCR